MQETEIKATIFIPTWFGDKYLDNLLESVFSQKCDFRYEVLIYDTSSKDRTVEIIKKYMKFNNNLRFKSINKKNFNHGLTRQLAAKDAKGSYVVYLTQDAIPAHDKWLHEIIRTFDFNKNIVAVLGSQQPRANAPPFLKREIKSVFRNLGNDDAISLYSKTSMHDKNIDFLGFYSDVNSATIKKFLLNEIPYRKADYAEDQIFGREIIQAGYIKAYNPKAKVIHSNEFKVLEYNKRMFDETMSLKRINTNLSKTTIIYEIKKLIKESIIDSIKIILDKEYSVFRKIYWIVVNPLYLINKWLGYHRAMSTSQYNNHQINKYSLEKNKNR